MNRGGKILRESRWVPDLDMFQDARNHDLAIKAGVFAQESGHENSPLRVDRAGDRSGGIEATKILGGGIEAGFFDQILFLISRE